MNAVVRVAAGCVVIVPAFAHGAILDLRSWIDANPAMPSSADNEWYATTGLGGALMTPTGSSWISAGQPFSTPLVGPIVDPGSENGAAGPATFEGAWVHPGSGIPAVIVFEPNEPVAIGAVRVRSELIANGLSGNGMTVRVLSTIGGMTTDLGTRPFGGVNDVLDEFALPAAAVLQPGDRVSVLVGDNGSFSFDHGNINVWIVVPGPGTALLVASAALAVSARRRR